MTALRFEQVSFRYAAPVVIDDASFAIEEGACVGVVGPNGGGKTTLFKLALGLLKPQTGKIEILDHSPHIGCKHIGYVPQHLQFDTKFPITAHEVVLMGRLDRLPWYGIYAKADRAVAADALAEVGLADLADRPFAAMSGGQKQRVLIARALAAEPDLLLLDEPTANIDLSVEEQFLKTLDRLPKGMTTLIISHDIGLLERMTDRVLCVNRHVHEHRVSDLDGHTIREIYSGELRHEHFGADHDHG
ncbi:MAG: zinc transport system ATP-binding protein [Verrucomicrobiales bacterium]|jgi:zinc transport system ATP-binding protein